MNKKTEKPFIKPTIKSSGGSELPSMDPEFLWELINATSDAAFLIDEEGTVITANEKTGQIYRIAITTLIGNRIYTYIPKKIALLSKEKVKEAVQSKKPVHFEIKLRKKYFENSIYPVLYDPGAVKRLAVYIRDITERKEVETVLKQTEEKYRNIFENATEGIFQVSAKGSFLSANPSLAKIHGYDSPEELINTITDISQQLYVHPSDRLKLTEELCKDGSVENFEVPMHRKDGSLHWISINARAITDRHGKILYHEGTMQDITKRKLAEEALAESEERYRVSIEHSNDGVAIIEGDKNRYVNRQFVRMFEYESPEEVLGKSVTLVVHPDDRDMVYNINLRRQRGEPVPSRYEFKGITKHGKTIYVEISAANIISRGKHYYLIFMRDVSKRKQAEETIRTERNRFQTLSENAPFGIALISKDGAFTYINPKFKELFGYDLTEIPNGRAWFRNAFPNPEYRKKVFLTWINDVRSTRSGEKTPRTFTVTTKDKIEKTINFIPVRLPTGEHIISFEDISERIKAQEALMHSHQELERLNRAKTKAVDHISHELKTPLAVIQGNMRVLKKRLQVSDADGSIAGIMGVMERNLKRLFGISKETDEIFRVSQELEAVIMLDELDRLWQRIENFQDIPPNIRLHWEALKGWMGKYLSGSTQSFQSVDLYPFVLQVVEKAKNSASHRKVKIHVEGEHDLYIFMDPSVLREVLASFLKNAIENTPDQGLIHITVEHKGDKIWVNVTDFGIGITEENQQYIFDGLFHTKETSLYTSKQPYDFGAGGKGFELLLIKAYAQRFGFEIKMSTKRCVFIPTDHDTCPGNISLCAHCSSREDCLNSGGTTFSVGFPAGKNPVSA